MKRRSFIILLGGASLPLLAHARQGGRVRRIAMLMTYAESDAEAQTWVSAFREALDKLGWSQNRNIAIDVRWTIGGKAATEGSARELVALQPDLILASTTPATAALLQQTRTIPIVFALVSDPVGSGFVASFPRPGGNVTGFTTMEPTMATKWLELLKEIAPHLTRIAVVFNPPNAPYIDFYMNPLRAAAPSFAVEVVAAPVHDVSELESASAVQARESGGGLLIWPDSFMAAHRAEIASMLAHHRLPAVSPFRAFVETGCLASYGSDSVDNFRRAATYVDRMLRGAEPGELPVQAPVKFELVINLKAIRSLGLAVPQSLLARADEVIE
jgi:ABC-type uncharacterized transport system substrate-binding protein